MSCRPPPPKGGTSAASGTVAGSTRCSTGILITSGPRTTSRERLDAHRRSVPSSTGVFSETLERLLPRLGRGQLGERLLVPVHQTRPIAVELGVQLDRAGHLVPEL